MVGIWALEVCHIVVPRSAIVVDGYVCMYYMYVLYAWARAWARLV